MVLLRKSALCIHIHTDDVTQCSSLRSSGRRNENNVTLLRSQDSLGAVTGAYEVQSRIITGRRSK